MKKFFVLLLSFIIAILFTACNKTQGNSSATESIISTITSVHSEFESSEDTPPSDESSLASPSFASKNEPISSASTTTSNDTSSSSDAQTFVQLADPNTGISWDGVSTIVYTYPDGTTGTEKRVGATYEQAPGVIGTIYEPTEPEEYDGRCNDCGKVEGDGTNGTCLQYWAGGGDHCPNCNEFVPEDTCHTCG